MNEFIILTITTIIVCALIYDGALLVRDYLRGRQRLDIPKPVVRCERLSREVSAVCARALKESGNARINFLVAAAIVAAIVLSILVTA